MTDAVRRDMRGWKLVPKNPTKQMADAYHQAVRDWLLSQPAEKAWPKTEIGARQVRVKNATLKMQLRWKAMLAAAPEPPK